jgi:hypothetical protein
LLTILGSKLKSKVLITTNEGVDDIEYSDEFIENWEAISLILSNKFKFSEDIVNKNTKLFIDIIILLQFCILVEFKLTNKSNNSLIISVSPLICGGNLFNKYINNSFSLKLG